MHLAQLLAVGKPLSILLAGVLLRQLLLIKYNSHIIALSQSLRFPLCLLHCHIQARSGPLQSRQDQMSSVVDPAQVPPGCWSRFTPHDFCH
jgi:hypothetical protein